MLDPQDDLCEDDLDSPNSEIFKEALNTVPNLKNI